MFVRTDVFYPTMNIRTHQLQYQYTGQPAMTFPDVECSSGEHALILGPSGTGKTTLLHLLGGILSPVSGEIFVADTAMHTLRGHALDRFRGKSIGIIFQKPHFIRSLTGFENLMLTQNLSGIPPDRNKALHLLDRLGIGAKKNKKTHTMSVGEQQRLAIARALVHQPGLILADEPSSALDDLNCRKMIDLLLQVASEHHANLIVVTHDSRIKEDIVKKIYLN